MPIRNHQMLASPGTGYLKTQRAAAATPASNRSSLRSQKTVKTRRAAICPPGSNRCSLRSHKNSYKLSGPRHAYQKATEARFARKKAVKTSVSRGAPIQNQQKLASLAKRQLKTRRAAAGPPGSNRCSLRSQKDSHNVDEPRYANPNPSEARFAREKIPKNSASCSRPARKQQKLASLAKDS